MLFICIYVYYCAYIIISLQLVNCSGQIFQMIWSSTCFNMPWYVWSSSSCFLRNGKMCRGYLLLISNHIFSVKMCVKLKLHTVCKCVKTRMFPRRTLNPANLGIYIPSVGSRRISGRFHLSHIAPWSTWLLLASPISLPLCTALSLFEHPDKCGENVRQNRNLDSHIPTMKENTSWTTLMKSKIHV